MLGQRYHVIVEANPLDDTRPKLAQNFWIRTVPADRCGSFVSPPDERTGIVFYSDSDHSILPNTTRAKFPTACSDEPYDKLVPIVPWTVGKPANERKYDKRNQCFRSLLTTSKEEASTFQVGLRLAPAPGPLPPPGDFSHWEMGKQPLWLDFSNPTILSVNQQKTDWAPQFVVVPQNVPSDSWVYLLVTATGFPFGTSPNRNFVPASHPVSLFERYVS